MSKRIKFTYLVIGILSLSIAVFTWQDYGSYHQEREISNIKLGEQAIERIRIQMDSLITVVENHANQLAPKITEIDDESELINLLKNESESISMLTGVTMAYEPGAFNEKDRLFSPFYDSQEDKLYFVEGEYDYTDTTGQIAGWYTDVINSNVPVWHRPGFAEVAEELVMDFGLPIKNDLGVPIGVLDYTISLEDLTMIVDTLSVGPAGYGFTLLPNGMFLTHPDKEYLLRKIQSMPADDNRTEGVNQILSEESGYVLFQSNYTFKDCYYFFTTHESTGWKSVIVFVADGDTFAETVSGRQKLILKYLTTSLFLFYLFLLIIGVHHATPKKLWAASIIFSVIAVINIILLWRMNLKIDYSQLDKENRRVVNELQLKKYMNSFLEYKSRKSSIEYYQVPTGFFITSLELKDSYSTGVAGTIWMKYPKEIYEDIPPSFTFPEGSAADYRSLTTELISETEYDNYILVKWKFRVNLRQDFSYKKYPFDQNDINMMLIYPDMNKNVLLIPDLESYEVMNPTLKPGLSESILLPSSRTIASYFSFLMQDFKSNFGDKNSDGEFPALQFNITLKRNFASPFVMNFIPLIIITIIMFVIVVSSSRTSNGSIGMTTMNVIQSSAGFMFILIIAHVNERSRILTPEITYIELFYFSSYFFIAGTAILLGAFFKGVDWKFFHHGDNLWMKILFWPLIMIMWLAATLYSFY